MVLYALNDRDSFDHCDLWRKEFEELVDEEKIAVMLVGTKMDLKEERVVTMQQAIAKIKSPGWKEMGALCGDCSSRTGYNVFSVAMLKESTYILVIW